MLLHVWCLYSVVFDTSEEKMINEYQTMAMSWFISHRENDFFCAFELWIMIIM